MNMQSTPQQQPSPYSTVWRDPLHAKGFSAYVRAPIARPATMATPGFGQAPASTPFKPRSFWRESLSLMEECVSFGRKRVCAGDQIYQCGEAFDTLYLINAGLFKIVNLAPDGREQPSGLFFKGDWLGFDGIPTGLFACSAVALDSGELWTVRYEDLLKKSATEPLLMHMVLSAVSAQLGRNRETSMSMGTLSADARVASFLVQWARSLQERSLRNDEFNLRMSRADLGDHLGLRLESVSRALTKLERAGVIRFKERGRRDISIPSLQALTEFIQQA